MLGSWLCSLYPKEVIGFSRAEADITNLQQVQAALESVKPDVVINAAGVVKSRYNTDYFGVNAEGPRVIALACEEKNIRMVHVSTDCIFKGDKGNYGETDAPDTDDAYGTSKLMGEVFYRPHLTVRTSFVGWPDYGGRGLLAWLKGESLLARVPGYDRVLWNGLTVWAMCQYLMELAHAPIYGVMHLHGQTLSKFHLLETVNKVYGWDYFIYPTDEPVLNRTLRSVRSDVPYIAGTYNFEESVGEMRKWENRILVS